MGLRPRRSVAGPGSERYGTVFFPCRPRLRAREEETKVEPGSGTAPGTAPRPRPPLPRAGHAGKGPAAARAPQWKSSRARPPRTPALPTLRSPHLSAGAETAPGPRSSPAGGRRSAQHGSRSRAPHAAPGSAAGAGRERCPQPRAAPAHSARPALRCRFPTPRAEERSEMKRYGKKERHFIGDFTMLESTMKVLVHSRKVGPKMVLCHSIYRFTQTFTKSL